jgi:hypothetical protein
MRAGADVKRGPNRIGGLPEAIDSYIDLSVGGPHGDVHLPPRAGGRSQIEERDALCTELIALEREGQTRVTRAAAIEARLKQIADQRGESFKVTLPNGDYVHVSPPCAAEFKGDVPVLQTEVWQGMRPARRESLLKVGLDYL